MIFAALQAPAPADLPWLAMIGLGGLGAVLSLDDTGLVQSWFSQPLPAGILAGAVCGDVQTGLVLGLPFQLLALGNLPVGQTFVGDRIGAVIVGTGALVLGGRELTTAALLGGDGAPLLGWLLTAMVLGSLVGHWGVQLERQAHFLWMIAGHRTLRDGRLAWLDRMHVRCLAVTAVRGFVAVLGGLLLLMWVWIPFFEYVPDRARAALALMPWLTPAIAAGVLLDRFGPRNCWRWSGAGLVGALLLTRWLV